MSASATDHSVTVSPPSGQQRRPGTLPLIDRRKARQASLARVINKALHVAGISHVRAAELTDTQRNIVDAYCHPGDMRRFLATHDVPALGESVTVAVAAWMLAHHGYEPVKLPESTSTPDQLHLLATTVRESSEATAAHADALADGRFTPDELRRLRDESTDAIRAHLAVRRFAEQELEKLGVR